MAEKKKQKKQKKKQTKRVAKAKKAKIKKQVVKKAVKAKKLQEKKQQKKIKPKKMEKEIEKMGETKKEFKAGLPKDKTVALKSLQTVLHPLITEKSIGMIESENKLVFVVSAFAQKSEVKNAVENLYNIKVDSVNILRDSKGRKRAFVKINKQFKADEIATKLGVL